MDQTVTGLALAQGHHHSGKRNSHIDGGAHGPAKQAAAATLEHAREAELAFVGQHVSRITYPELIRLGWGRQRRESVGVIGWECRLSVVRPIYLRRCRTRRPSCRIKSSEAMLTDGLALSLQFHRDPWAAVVFP